MASFLNFSDENSEMAVSGMAWKDKIKAAGYTTAILGSNQPSMNGISLKGNQLVNESEFKGMYMITDLKGDMMASGNIEAHQDAEITINLRSGSYYLVTQVQSKKAFQKMTILQD
jgi:hypothetical protein